MGLASARGWGALATTARQGGAEVVGGAAEVDGAQGGLSRWTARGVGCGGGRRAVVGGGGRRAGWAVEEDGALGWAAMGHKQTGLLRCQQIYKLRIVPHGSLNCANTCL
jgi:hypothetical protein